ncbi:MAG TPA: hypothetical protein VNX18_06790 [Bryobacteraceae bacterium]|jgi:hypothetical protein|nr:hypothetical protein [Bryobacteraceae bacterium]
MSDSNRRPTQGYRAQPGPIALNIFLRGTLVRLAVCAIAAACTATAQDKKVIINDRWPIQDPSGKPELSPPHVEPTNECSKSVYVDGFIPHATITVFRGGGVIGVPFVSTFGFADVPVPQLHTGDQITAIQTVNGVNSAHSAIMAVGKMPTTLPKPTVEPKIYACGRVVPVHNLVPGVTVDVSDDTAGTVIGSGATPNLWGGDWDPVSTSALIKGHKISAKVSACTGVPSVGSAQVTVLPEPSPFKAPTLDTPIIGNDAITAHGLYIGSLLQAFQPGLIGSGFSTAESNWMEVATIKAAPGVIAEQDLCTKGPKTPPYTPTNNIPPPTLVGPICPGQPGAIVRNTTINATLVLLKNGAVVGYGGAGPGDVPLNLATPASFAQNDTVQVVEYIGTNVVLSNTIIVGCTNTITYHNDSQRTGWNQAENTLKPSNVTPSTFGFITKTVLDDQVDTQPLVVTNQDIDGEVHTAVYVATEGNTVFAIDSWSGDILKQRNLGAPIGTPLGCTNNGPNVGINGTPTIDVRTRTLYVMAYTTVSGKPAYRLHALDLGTLNDKPGSPVTVSASNGSVTFNAAVQRQRSALLLANGNVYAAFASFCDFSPDQSRGWLLGWNAGTLAPLAANELTDRRHNTFGVCSGGANNGKSCSSSSGCPGGACKPYYLSSIWMSGYGVAADPVGNVFFVTGNSDWTKNTYDGTTNIQESVVKMTGDLSKVLDLFTPSNVFPLDQADADYGSGGVLVLPDQPGPVPRLAVAAGKDGRNFILNRDKMGGFHNPDIPKNVVVDACWCGPAYFKGSDGVGRVVSSGGLQAKTWKVNTALSPALTLEGSAAALPSGPQDGGFFTTVSSHGTTANTEVIWAVARPSGGDNHLTLVAFNGTASGASLAQLWSGSAGTWPNTGGNANQVPTVANGRVYVTSYKQLQIFGLRGKSKGRPIPGRFQEITQAPPPIPRPENQPGASYWGVVKSVNGPRIEITLRNGKTLPVDLSEALKAGTTINPVVGGNVAASGTLNPNGLLAASTLTRAKARASWGTDRSK